MQLFDTHCHLDLPAFDPDRTRVLQDARAAGVSDMLVPGISRRRWEGLVELCAREHGLHLALGMHPMFMEEHLLEHVDELEDWIVRHRPIAVGEIGLDYRVDADARQKQRLLLEAQLDVACRHALPVVLHIVKAQDDMLRILHGFDHVGGICHAFNGSLQQAEGFIGMGFKLGFGGMLTYERSTRLRRLASELPLDALVLETDAPDMPGAAHRYGRNSPAWLPEVLESLADLRNEDRQTLGKTLLTNSRAALGLAHTT